MKRLGTVLVFNPDATKEEIEKALASIKDVIDAGYNIHSKDGVPPVYDFDDDCGGPVWYIP